MNNLASIFNKACIQPVNLDTYNNLVNFLRNKKYCEKNTKRITIGFGYN